MQLMLANVLTMKGFPVAVLTYVSGIGCRTNGMTAYFGERWL